MPRNTTKTLGATNGGRGGLAGYTELCESIAQFKIDSVRPTGGPRIQNFDSFAPFEILKTWGPLLLFVVVWLYSMHRYSTQYRQPWDQILRRLEGIENHLARIASLLEERRGK